MRFVEKTCHGNGRRVKKTCRESAPSCKRCYLRNAPLSSFIHSDALHATRALGAHFAFARPLLLLQCLQRCFHSARASSPEAKWPHQKSLAAGNDFLSQRKLRSSSPSPLTSSEDVLRLTEVTLGAQVERSLPVTDLQNYSLLWQKKIQSGWHLAKSLRRRIGLR